MTDVAALLAEVKAALQQATPGAWTDLHNGAVVADGRAIPATFDDARLIAKAREWLGALVQAVEDGQREVSRLRADGQRLAGTLDKIAAVMRDRTATEDEALSEMQDFLTIAGYDVPLRSGKPSRGSDQ